MTSSRQLAGSKELWILLALGLAVPLLGMTGIVGANTVQLWGRYLAFSLAAVGVNLMWGYTGILPLCQAFFFCLGGYAIGMHMLLLTGTQGSYGAAIPDFMVWNGVKVLPAFWEPFRSFPMAVFLGLAVPAAAAGIFGIAAFRSRIRGVYFSIITQAFALAMWLVFLRNETMLGGTNGLTDFKTLLGMKLSSPGTQRILAAATAVVLVGVLVGMKWGLSTKFGRVLIAIRDSEFRLRFTGYPVWRYKAFVFVLGAMVAAMGGMLYVPQTGIVTPGRMTVQSSIEIVVWTALGGRGTLLGPVVGAVAVNMLYSWLTGAFPQSWLYVLGGLFLLVVLVIPDGITGLAQRLMARRKAEILP
jgi:urea transport system permease protein